MKCSLNIRKPLIIGMLGLASICPLKAQKAMQVIPEVGVFGNVKSVPTLVGGINGAIAEGNNYADVFIGGTLSNQGVPGFSGIVFDNLSWSKNFSSWARDFFLASKNGVTSTLDFAPIKYNAQAGKFNFSVMPAYSRNDDFVNHTATHNVKVISQTMLSMTPKDRLCLEMQYGTIPTENINDTYFGNFSDSFGFTTTYSRVIGK